MNSFFDSKIFGNTILDWCICIGIILIGIVIARIFQTLILKRIAKFTERTKGHFDDFIISLLQRFGMPFLYIIAVYTGIQYLYLSTKTEQVIRAAVVVVSVFFVIRAITAAISYFFNEYVHRTTGQNPRQKQVRGILFIIKAIIWTLGIVFLIDNLGYDITTIVAGLGIGGIAIALAAQTVLGDLFSYVVIFFDKPFEVGDFIVVEDKMGSIEYIGIKTTRLRALSGEQIIVSNSYLTNQRVHNYKRMRERRIVFNFGVAYDTAADKLRKIPSIIRQIIELHNEVKFDRAHFTSFGNSSLNYEIVYIVLTDDYNVYMDVQQSINLKIMEKFQREGIEFALPTQTLIIEREKLAAE